jgi:hypothetical protein
VFKVKNCGKASAGFGVSLSSPLALSSPDDGFETTQLFRFEWTGSSPPKASFHFQGPNFLGKLDSHRRHMSVETLLNQVVPGYNGCITILRDDFQTFCLNEGVFCFEDFNLLIFLNLLPHFSLCRPSKKCQGCFFP